MQEAPCQQSTKCRSACYRSCEHGSFPGSPHAVQGVRPCTLHVCAMSCTARCSSPEQGGNAHLRAAVDELRHAQVLPQREQQRWDDAGQHALPAALAAAEGALRKALALADGGRQARDAACARMQFAGQR
jgi:hypothetical protein